MKKITIIMLTVLIAIFILIPYSIQGADTYATLTFGLKSDVQGPTIENNSVTLSNPSPANESTGISITTDFWNITIEDPEGDTFNWTIEGNGTLGTNTSTDCTNGSYNISITGNLSYNTTYTIWVNASDNSINWTNESFIFTTENESTGGTTVYDTLSFGGKADIQDEYPIISNVGPTNGSTDILLYPWLNVTVTDPQSNPMNVTWLYNLGAGWIEFAYNTTTSGSTVRQRATFANNSQTVYNWSVHVNDSNPSWTNATYKFTTYEYTWGDWSDWWEFNYTAEAPTNLSVSTYNENALNISWDNPTNGGWDSVVLLRNSSTHANYPFTPSNGTVIYNGTNETYNDTGLAKSTTYFYTIWTWNETNAEYSTNNDTASGTTQGDIAICCSYPPNTSTGNSRPPTNVSIRVNGTGFDVYLYFNNMTGTSNVTTLFANWSSENTGYFSFDEFNWTTPGNEVTDWIWGNVRYIWYVNVTDGSTWYNRSYYYDTDGSRYDVDGSGDVIASDASRTWSHRTGETTYNGIYDVNYGGDITATDASLVWANRT